ncbi:hypothetical protein BCR37DRAFT_386746 [Protomyces lactucae-debilis]|uniref:Uncharacterized protein n=1 Tax=Protomyces lactucae-debilis TaxID=2754530 RepID=A0A1Y2FIE8_PROLT|nr:uncharacterized protein BCR37DRAFT_386746 [Protomyces lactucae-debilis]ORY83719.1 hypothetical protein BCR37DRAFT_386746 [Protomyces lactucae-debilis]
MLFAVSQALFILSLIQEHLADQPGTCPRRLPYPSLFLDDGTCYDGDFILMKLGLVPDSLPCTVWCHGQAQKYLQSLTVSSLLVKSPVSLCSVGKQSLSYRTTYLSFSTMFGLMDGYERYIARVAAKYKASISGTPPPSTLGKRAFQDSKKSDKLTGSSRPPFSPFSALTLYRLLWMTTSELIRHYWDMDYIRQFTVNLYRQEEEEGRAEYAELGSRLNNYLGYLKRSAGLEELPTGNGDASKAKSKEGESGSVTALNWRLCKCEVAIKFNRMLLATGPAADPAIDLLFQTLCKPQYVSQYLASLPYSWSLDKANSLIIDSKETYPPQAKSLTTFLADENQQRGFSCETANGLFGTDRVCQSMRRPGWVQLKCWDSLKLATRKQRDRPQPNCRNPMPLLRDPNPYL